MPKPCIILVTGLPGTGKTTLARQLAARYRVPLIGKDLIKEPLLDVLGARDAAESRKLSDASFAVVFAIARELSAGGAHVLLEGNFRPGEHEMALRAAFALHRAPQLAQVLCIADESERRARLSARRMDPTRHAGHRDSEQAGLSASAHANGFLDLPGERFVHDGAGDHEVPAALDDWWNLRTNSPKNRPAGERRQ